MKEHSRTLVQGTWRESQTLNPELRVQGLGSRCLGSRVQGSKP